MRKEIAKAKQPLGEWFRKHAHKKPSVVVNAVIEGVKRFSASPRFEVDMLTWGSWEANEKPGEPPICVGCLATCFIQEIEKIEFEWSIITSRRSRARTTRTTKDYLMRVETAVDRLRYGEVYKILRLCEFSDQESTEIENFLLKEELRELADFPIISASDSDRWLPILESIKVKLEKEGY